MISFLEMKRAAREHLSHTCAQTINGQPLQVRWDKVTELYHWSYGQRGSGPCSLSPSAVREIIASARAAA